MIRKYVTLRLVLALFCYANQYFILFSIFYFSKVSDPDDVILFEKNIRINSDVVDHSQNIETRGVHKICFSVLGDDEITAYFNIDYKNKGLEFKGSDPGRKIEKGDIPTLADQLKKAELHLSDISREIDFARRQESLLRIAGGNAIF